MVTVGTGVYLLQQLVALISGDTPHEYAGDPTLVELTVDEGKRFGPAGDASGFCLVGRELPLNQPLEDGEAPVEILEVYLWWLVYCHDLGPLLFGWLLALFSHRRLMLIAREDTVWNRAATRCRFHKHIGRFIVVAQHVVQLEAVEFSLQISYGLEICCHLQVNAVLVLHNLSHDQFRVTPDLKTPDPELSCDPKTVDLGFILGGVV
jgi:hypothetical protein